MMETDRTKATGSLWSEVISPRGFEWKCQGEKDDQIGPGAGERPLLWGPLWGAHWQKPPVTQPTHTGPGKLVREKHCTRSESQDIWSMYTPGQLTLWVSSGAVIRKCWLRASGVGGHTESPVPQNAFCFMATCSHLRGEMGRGAVFLLAMG